MSAVSKASKTGIVLLLLGWCWLLLGMPRLRDLPSDNALVRGDSPPVTTVYIAWIPPIGYYQNRTSEQTGRQIRYYEGFEAKLRQWYSSLGEEVQKRVAVRMVEMILIQQPRNSSAYEEHGLGWTGKAVLRWAVPTPSFKLFKRLPFPQPHQDPELVEPISFAEFVKQGGRHLDRFYGVLGPWVMEGIFEKEPLEGQPVGPIQAELMNETWNVDRQHNTNDPLPTGDELLGKRTVRIGVWYEYGTCRRFTLFYPKTRDYLPDSPCYDIWTNSTRFSDAIEREADRFISNHLSPSFIALQWRAGDRFSSEMKGLGARGFKWADTKYVKERAERALREGNASKVFIMTNAGAKLRAKLREILEYHTVPPGEVEDEAWGLTLDQAIATRARIFVMSGNKYHHSASLGKMVADRRLLERNLSISTLHYCKKVMTKHNIKIKKIRKRRRRKRRRGRGRDDEDRGDFENQERTASLSE
eukprot:Sspe_Gene.21735::Locus_8175_Transcript_1_1_Confidence_1.000_Length_1483::g.21735::m.21735